MVDCGIPARIKFTTTCLPIGICATISRNWESFAILCPSTSVIKSTGRNFAVSAGDRVRRGDVIAYVGATGEATGPHLHYQLMLDGRTIDPEPYLNGIPQRVLATLPPPGRVQ